MSQEALLGGAVETKPLSCQQGRWSNNLSISMHVAAAGLHGIAQAHVTVHVTEVKLSSLDLVSV